MSRLPLVVFLLAASLATPCQAGQVGAATPLASATPVRDRELPVLDGPPAPVPPEVVSRDASGRVTLRAVRLTAPLRVDGRLDEAVYASVPPISDFVQSEPVAGAAATERTDVWILYDADNVYVVSRCWESHPERMVVNEMRRDTGNVAQNENFGFVFDTFYDRRNGVWFETTPIGGRIDGQLNNDGQVVNMDWNPIWEVKLGRFEGGWVVEAAIPFKSLRYRSRTAQVWGFNARRINRWKNEVSFLSPLPAEQGTRGILKISLGATLVGLEAPTRSTTIEVKPYAITNLTSDAPTLVSNDVSADAGFDVKFGVTQNLTADFTYNTDFAQVEADEQQVNLTRFNLSFPEKREFFLENRGTFAFGGAGGMGGPSAAGSAGDAPQLFYSRRIGLSANGAVPVELGGRLTGRVGRFNLGLLSIRTGDQPESASRPTNFSVFRLKRDILRKSSVGLIFTGRSVSTVAPGSNEAYGVDGSFGFFDALNINTYWARTRTDGLAGDDLSYRGQLDYNGDRYGVQLERLAVGDAFNPETGFVRRDDMRLNLAQLRFSPRPRRIKAVRKFSWTGAISYIQNGAGQLESRDAGIDFSTQFQNSDQFNLTFSSLHESLSAPFRIAPDVTLPVGGYDFANGTVGFNFGRQRRLAGNVTLERGTFYDGHKTALTIAQGGVKISPQLAVEPSYVGNWIDLHEGSFTTHLFGARTIYTMTPQMFASALVQYNSSSQSVTANVRLRWEYQPGSELFVVYNDQRDTASRYGSSLVNRAFVVKFNRLFRL